MSIEVVLYHKIEMTCQNHLALLPRLIPTIYAGL